ncbi:hypothetical protein K2X85_16390 [bacterium]|nr:hypothetical protein [bacterium]
MNLFFDAESPSLSRYGLSGEEFDELFPSYESPSIRVKSPVAISQLRSRGYDASGSFLISHFAAIKRDIPADWKRIDAVLRPDGGKDFLWSREMIDELADGMEAVGRFTPSGTAAMLDGYRLADRIRETRRVAPNPGSDDVVITIIPGLPGAGVPATVKCRPLTKDEIAARELAAKQLTKKSKRKE